MPSRMPEPDEGDTTRDAVLGGRITLRQPRKGHRVGHDAILLSAFAPASARRVVDLGAGVGSAGLAFLARVPEAAAVLVEIDPLLAALAQANIADNALAGRCRAVEGDVMKVARPKGPQEPRPAAADLVLMNPPYNADTRHQSSPEAGRALAHMADGDTLDQWARAAYRCLKPGGTLCLIHRPEGLAAVLDALKGRFGALEVLPVHPGPSLPAARILVRAVKGRRTAPAFLPGLILADADGLPSPAAEAVLRHGAGLSPP